MQTGLSSSGMDLVLSRNKPMRIRRQKAASKVSFASVLLGCASTACAEGNVPSDD